MHDYNEPPEGYKWVEHLASESKISVDNLVTLCEKQYIQAVRLQGRWAVQVIREGNMPHLSANAAVVRDLKSGRDITIGSVIGQYINVDSTTRTKDKAKYAEQVPLREKIERTGALLRLTWMILGGGVAFFLAGAVIAWPFITIIATMALNNASAAMDMAQDIGDRAAIQDAQEMLRKAQITAAILWGGIALTGCAILGSFLL